MALGRCGEAENRVDMEDSTPLTLEGPYQERAADAVPTDRLIRAAM